MIVYLARDIPAFVMYCVNGESGSSLLIESTYSMIIAVVVIIIIIAMYYCVLTSLPPKLFSIASFLVHCVEK